MVNDLIIYIMIAAAGLVVLLVLLIVQLFKKYKEKILTKLIAAKDKFMWNGMTRSILISYAKLVMTVGV